MKQAIKALLFLFNLFLSNCSFIKLEVGMTKDVNYNVHIITKEANLKIPSDIDKDHPKLSIIVPIRNGGKNIRNVVRSIEHQTLEEIEILLVDDGSKDYSLKLMKELKQEDKRIRVIKHKKNKGALYTKINSALKAKGEYVTFIEVDDAYCNAGILKEVYEKARDNDLDFIQFDYFVGLFDGDEAYNSKLLSTGAKKDVYSKVMKQPEILKNFYDIYKEKQDSISSNAFDKFYKKELIEKIAKKIGDDFWKEKITYADDLVISLATAQEANSCMLLPVGGLWHWYDNPDGRAAGTYDMEGDKLKFPKKTNRNLSHYLQVMDKVFDLTEKDPKSEEFRVNLIDTIIKPDEHRLVFALTESFEKIMEICKRFVKWDHISKSNIKYIKDFARETITYTIDNKQYSIYKMKYALFYEGPGTEDL